ncbi:MAG: hypothetical protein GY711_35210 [bacterium]|nr:hypothetical protein [bacterium]
MATTQGLVIGFVRDNQGCSVTEVAASLKLSTKDLRLPILKLVESGKLRTTGQRRGTRYHTGSGRRTTKKATRKTTKRATRRKSTKKKVGRKKAR